MTWFVAALVAFLVVYNNLSAWRPLPDWTYVPLNFTVALTLPALAHWRGLTWSELGLGREGVAPGLRAGGFLALVIAAVLALTFVVPGAERLLMDRRVAAMSVAGVVYAALVRVPLGTVVLEEVAFRGVLYGAWQRVASPTTAAIASSVVFGLWHVGPTIELLRANSPDRTAAATVAVVALGVAATTIGGLAFVWLRVRTHGVMAPMIVHTATNSLATVAAYAWQRANAEAS